MIEFYQPVDPLRLHPHQPGQYSHTTQIKDAALPSVRNTLKREPSNTYHPHWPLDEVHITVYLEDWAETQRIKHAPRPPNDKAGALLHQAMETWNAVANVPVKLQQVSHENEAKILIRWQDETHAHRPYETGRTENETSAEGYITRSTIHVLREPAIYLHLSPEAQEAQLLATFLHELGHALGLEHTQHPLSVMHHRSLQNTVLTNEDIRQLQRLYS